MLSCFSHVRLCATTWTAGYQASQRSLGFSRQEYWSGLPCPPPGDLSHPGIKPASLISPALGGGFFTTSATWSLLLFDFSVMSNSLWPHGLQHTRLPCPSPPPRSCSNSYPLSQWCHPTISSSIISSSCLQSFPASGSFVISWLFASGGQIRWSFSFSISPPSDYSGSISFRTDWFDLFAVQGTL